MRYAPRFDPSSVEDGGWYNYAFDTDLCCPKRCAPGAHPLYIGKSNDPHRRLGEHEQDKPWFRYSTGWRIFPERYATEAEALAAERARIRTYRPLANIEHNEGNDHRMWFGPTGHAVSVRRPRRVVGARSRGRVSVGRRRVPRWVWRLVRLATLWLMLAVALFLLTPAHVGSGVAAEGSGFAAALLVWLLQPRRRRRRRRW